MSKYSEALYSVFLILNIILALLARQPGFVFISLALLYLPDLLRRDR